MRLEEILGDVIGDIRFTGVYVMDQDLVYVRAIIGDLDAQECDHTVVLRWQSGQWGQYMVPAVTTAHCVIAESGRKVLCLCPDGAVHVATPEGFGWEQIRPAGEEPRISQSLVTIADIEGTVYVAGMSRQVFKRLTENRWIRWDNGIRETPDLESGGFLSIDGYDGGKLYAAGFHGEIWHFDGTTWSLVESPTNLKIERILCVNSEISFACGGGGIVLRAKNGLWEPIAQDLTRSTFWGMTFFKGNLYVADSSTIYRYDGEELARVETGIQGIGSASYLHSSEDVLWSVGEKYITVFDGADWHRLF